MRPSYFPFTEPSAEVDVGYTLEKGKRVLGGSEGWMEVLGSGMVTREVIANCGLDPDEWQGFAFGAASIGWRCSNTGWTTCAPSSTAISAG